MEQRRLQILDASRRCFARKGFYETSMQDVFRESGLSAGAVYRYFQSKDQLIQAISAGVFSQMATIMETALKEEPFPGLGQLAGRLAEAAQELGGEEGPVRIALAAWAAALHSPDIAVTVRGVLGPLRELWVMAVTRMRDEGRLPPDIDVNAMGAALSGLLPGFLVQHLILGDPDAATFERGVTQLLGCFSGS